MTAVHAPVGVDWPMPDARTAAEDLDQALARTAAQRTPRWALRYRTTLLVLDLAAIVAAVIIGLALRFDSLAEASSLEYLVCGVGITLGWIAALQYYGGYEIRHLASGPEELKRVFRASAVTLSLLAIACYVTKTPIARGFVIGVIPLGALLLVTERTLVRRWVAARRERGEWMYRILAVGTSESLLHLHEITQRAKGAGLRIVGACVEDAVVGRELAPALPVLGGVLDAARCAEQIDADVVAVTGSGLGPRAVRELGWALEGTSRGLVMAPALTEIAGSRVHVSPVEGLPLVWLEKAQLGRLPGLVKRAVDVVVAALVLLVFSPVLLGTAAAIKATSRGPVFFRQSRLGVGGTEFRIVKFRSMFVGADRRRDEILELNEQAGGGVLFKIRHDPRVTPVGRWIRKLSIDELPQLVHVLSGTMSLVGPRPLATVDSVYTGAARRRLLVKPGVTGLWQISGRSETTWDDAVRMDLYYVENWSLGLDLSILFRTIFAVLGSRGAY